MKISLEDLRAVPLNRSKIQFKEELPIKEAVRPVVAELSVRSNPSGLQIFGTVQTLLKLMCHSCLRPFFQSLTLELDESFVYEHYLNDELKEHREKELQSADFVEAIPFYGVLDISDLVFQAVTLATPIYCSCGPECLGPPQQAEASAGTAFAQPQPAKSELNSDSVDPRWKNLKTLFPKEETP